ncbi:ribonuclease H-like domain-containing protein [Tanacetum coccineum]
MTAKQLAAKRNQEIVKSILLLAIPDEYLLKFHNVSDAKSLWVVIKSRFGGNDESKKMQKNVLKHQFENFTTASNESLDKAYDSTKSGDFGVSTAGGISQVSSTPCAHDVVCSFFAQSTTIPQLKNEDFQQINEDDLEELDLRWQVAMLTVRCYNCHRKGHFARECRSGRNQGKRSYGDNGRSNAPTNESSSQALVAQDGLGGYDWSNDLKQNQSSDEENTPANDSFSKVDGFHVVPPPITGNFLTPRADISFADDEELFEVQTVSPVKTNETQTVKTRVDKIGQTSQKQGIGFKKIKACFVCKSTDHLIKDCTFHDRQSQEPKLKTMVNTGPRVDKPVWDNTKRVNHQKISKYPHLRKTFVPSGVLTRTDLDRRPFYAPTGETSAPPAPKTVKQLAAKRNQERVKNILLLAIPGEYLLKFYNVADAKSLW